MRRRRHRDLDQTRLIPVSKADLRVVLFALEDRMGRMAAGEKWAAFEAAQQIRARLTDELGRF